MFDKLEELEKKYNKLQKDLYDPEISSDPQKAMEIWKELSSIEEVYTLYQEYKKDKSQIDEAKEILKNEKDKEMLELAKIELEEAEEKIEIIQKKLKIVLLPKDPNDDKNIFIEIRPAAWWDEAWLFAWEIMRMYMRYAEIKWRDTKIMEHQVNWIWWLKFALIKIKWYKIYSKMKFESWVHRVQRIPETESIWRVHTSTVTVAVLPEVTDVNIEIKNEDIEMDTFAASSAGWQHANKNQTWIRLHHKPTWIIVTWTDSRSQLQNKENAMKILKLKIYQIELEKQQKEQKDNRVNQIWTWDRSEKIRTYNFPQDRVTDHRIKKSWSNLPWIMNWEIDPIIESMFIENQAMLLWANNK